MERIAEKKYSEFKGEPQKVVPDWAIKILGGSDQSLIVRNLPRTAGGDGTFKVVYPKGGAGLLGAHLEEGTEGYGWVINSHTLLEWAAADTICDWLEEEDVLVDREAILVAVLLHDVGKGFDQRILRNKDFLKERPKRAKRIEEWGHGAISAIMVNKAVRGLVKEENLKGEWIEKLNRMIRAHDQLVSDPVKPETLEEQIVFLVDHISGETVVEPDGRKRLKTWQERMAGIGRRYLGKKIDQEHYDAYYRLVEETEKEIFGRVLKKSHVTEELPVGRTGSLDQLIKQIEGSLGVTINFN